MKRSRFRGGKGGAQNPIPLELERSVMGEKRDPMSNFVRLKAKRVGYRRREGWGGERRNPRLIKKKEMGRAGKGMNSTHGLNGEMANSRVEKNVTRALKST